MDAFDVYQYHGYKRLIFNLFHRYTARNDSPLLDIFCGQLKSTVECLSCRKQSTVFDPFWDLSLPIPKQYQQRGGGGGRYGSSFSSYWSSFSR